MILDVIGPLELNDILKSLSKSHDAYTHYFSRSFMFIKYVCACICDVQLTKNYVTLISLIQQNYSILNKFSPLSLPHTGSTWTMVPVPPYGTRQQWKAHQYPRFCWDTISHCTIDADTNQTAIINISVGITFIQLTMKQFLWGYVIVQALIDNKSRGVTHIGAVYRAATGVKIFDRRKMALTA